MLRPMAGKKLLHRFLQRYGAAGIEIGQPSLHGSNGLRFVRLAESQQLLVNVRTYDDIVAMRSID